MLALLLAVGVGWSAELLVQATLPLLILDRGGDAALVGLVAACYAIPTLVLRPVIGRYIDRTGHGPIHQGGGLLLTLAPLGFLLVSGVAVPIARLVQGLGWAMYGTANNVVLARLAPPSRRGEASGYFNVMWALGFLVGPPIGLALYAGVGREVPFVVGALLAFSGLVTVTVLRRLLRGAHSADVARAVGASPPAIVTTAAAPWPRRWAGRLVEPAAVPTMGVLATFMAGQALFLGFAPVYARTVGAPDTVLALYFPMYGILLALGQLLTGRLSDRFGRRATILGGIALGTVGLIVAAVADGWTVFAIGAATYSVAAAIVNPASAAATIDRAPDGRIGVSMATFSIGYQLAAGVGGAAWGVIIVSAGFGWAFASAILLQAACVALTVRYLGPPRAHPQPPHGSAVGGSR